MPAAQVVSERWPGCQRVQRNIAIKAWNFYAMWTWLLRLLPACLIIFLIGFFICAALGALPFVFHFFK